MTIGVTLIIIGVVFLVISGISMALKGKNNVNVAVGGFIGPIPFGFFTSRQAFWLWLIVVAIGIVFWLIARRVI